MLWWLRLGFGVGIFVLLFKSVNLSELLYVLRSANWGLIAIVFCGAFLSHFFGVAMWRAIVGATVNPPLNWLDAVKTYSAAQALGVFTPAGLGRDAYLLFSVTENGGEWQKGVTALGILRGTSVLALAVLSIVATFFIPLPKGWKALLAGVIAVTVIVFGALLFGARFLHHPILPRKWRERVEKFLPETKALMHAIVMGLAWGTAFYATNIAFGYLLIFAIGGRGKPLSVLAILTLTNMVNLLPITIAGLGVTEGTLLLLAPLSGLTKEVALSAALVGRGIFLCLTLFGVLCLFLDRRERKMARRNHPLPEETIWARRRTCE